MLTSIGYYHVIFLTISTLFPRTSQNSMEKIADVIKNITRVNNVLQDLIKNYEHLENIYRSKEMIENYVSNVPTKTSVATNKTASDQNVFTYSTGLITDGQNHENRKGLHGLKRKVKSKILIGKPTININLEFKERPTKHTTPQILFIDIFGNNNLNALKQVTTPKKKRFNVQLKNNMKREGKHFEMVANETAKYFTLTRVSFTTTAAKTFAIVGTTTPSPNGLFIKIKGTIKKPGKMYVLGGNMKNKTILDINDINGTKTHLKKNIEVKRAITDQNLESRDLELVMASDNETSDESGNVLSIELPVKNDDTINKDIFKTNILRKAYGDACLKLVVKKCHMACKNTIQSVCKHSSCKKGVKKTFNKSYKEKCNELFGDMMLRSNSPSMDVDDDTKTYMAAVCDPISSSASTNMTTKPPQTQSKSTSKYANELHILRAKYEKACVNTSREKCRDACTFAYTAACKGDKCNSKKTRNFRKTCARQCKIAYRLRLTTRDSSSSSSSSSSDEI